MKGACNILQLLRIGESSSDAAVYSFECNGKLLVAKVRLQGDSLRDEYRLMRSLSNTGIVPRVMKFEDEIIIMQHVPMTLSRWLTVVDTNEMMYIAANLVTKLKNFHVSTRLIIYVPSRYGFGTVQVSK